MQVYVLSQPPERGFTAGMPRFRRRAFGSADACMRTMQAEGWTLATAYCMDRQVIAFTQRGDFCTFTPVEVEE